MAVRLSALEWHDVEMSLVHMELEVVCPKVGLSTVLILADERSVIQIATVNVSMQRCCCWERGVETSRIRTGVLAACTA